MWEFGKFYNSHFYDKTSETISDSAECNLQLWYTVVTWVIVAAVPCVIQNANFYFIDQQELILWSNSQVESRNSVLLLTSN